MTTLDGNAVHTQIHDAARRLEDLHAEEGPARTALEASVRALDLIATGLVLATTDEAYGNESAEDGHADPADEARGETSGEAHDWTIR